MTGAQHSDELAQELVRHARLQHMLKSRLSALGPAGLDAASFGVLMAMVKCGPRRQGELAEMTLLDPSTVSRYVAQLVRTGLASRRPDPADGRAVQLVATESGVAVAEGAVERRRAVIGDLLADWDTEDAGALIRLLRRLNDGMECRRDGGEQAGRSTGTTDT